MNRVRSAKGRAGAKVLTTDAQIDEAIAQANIYEGRSARVIKASYRPKGGLIVLVLSSGIEVAIPRALLQGLQGAKPEDLRQIKIEGPGTGLHWPALGVDHYVPELLRGAFGTRQWMAAWGKKGGKARTPAKAAASRKNGRRGGRPRKQASKRAA